MKVSGGLCVASGGLTVATAQGMKIELGGLTVDHNLKVGTDLTVGNAMKVANGLCIIGGGFTMAGALYFRQISTTVYRYMYPYTTASTSVRIQPGRRLGDGETMVDDEPEGPLSSQSYLGRMLGGVESSDEGDELQHGSSMIPLHGVTEYLMTADIRLNRFELDFDELRDEYLDTQDDVLRLADDLATLKDQLNDQMSELWKKVEELSG
jgi:hypothetical protein